jgi:hypothetical protein
MQTRSLRLRRETLTALTTEEMALLAAAGNGDPEPTPPVYAPPTLQVKYCVTTATNSAVVCSGLDCYSRGTTCAC